MSALNLGAANNIPIQTRTELLKGSNEPQALVATNPGAIQRTKITTHQPHKNLLPGKQSSQPSSEPLSKRQIAQKPESLRKALDIFQKGVSQTVTVIENIKKETPSTAKEKRMQANQIKDTIKYMKRLEKAILKETKEVRLLHNMVEYSLDIETPENQALYQESSGLLDTLSKNIKALKTMR